MQGPANFREQVTQFRLADHHLSPCGMNCLGPQDGLVKFTEDVCIPNTEQKHVLSAYI